MCLYYYYCSLCAKKAWNVWSCFWEPRPRPNFKPLQCLRSEKQANFPLIYPKKAVEWAELQIPLLNYLRYQVCILVTKCKNIYSGSYFPSLTALSLQVCCVCFAAADSGLSLVLCTSSLCFRQQAAHKPQRSCARILQVRSRQGLNARWIPKSFDLSQAVTVAGRTALLNDADCECFYHSLTFPL